MSRHRAEAVDAVQAWLLGFDEGVRRLRRSDLDRYKGREPHAGWRLSVEIGDSVQELDLLLDTRFPRTPPRIILPAIRRGLILPHVEKDGGLCLFPTSSSVSIVDAAALAQNAVGSAVRLVEESVLGVNEGDFRAEFRSYWDLHASTAPPVVWSLLETSPESRMIRVWCGKAMYVAAEDDASATRWLVHRFPQKRASEYTLDDAVLVWLEHAPLPREYPRTALDVLRIAENAGSKASRLIASLASTAPDRLVVILGFRAAAGPCFAATVLSRPQRSLVGGRKGSDPLTVGYRPGRVPPEITVKRYFGHQGIRCAEVDRMDAAWVHGRDGDPRASQLRGKRVAVLGCGSVGAPVSIALAQAGVGALALVDPQVLVPANIGRHPLGAAKVGSHKATALAEMIRLNLPHILSVDDYTTRWDCAARAKSGLLQDCDLIISTIGDWGAEGALNEWHLAQGRRTPIVYGWTEAHACAGHAVAIYDVGGCLQCGLSALGEPYSKVTEWPDGPPMLEEPACGATFQPYGPVELGYVTALISELALDSLLGMITTSTHRTWIARRTLLESVGGEWTSEWRERTGRQPVGGFIDEQPWSPTEHCAECKARPE